MFHLWTHPKKFFDNEVNNRRLVWYSLPLILIANVVIAMIGLSLLEIPINSKMILFFIVIGGVVIPLYYIFNGIITALYALVATFVKSDLSMKRVYSLLINVTALPFMVSSIILLVILNNNNIYYVINMNFIQLIINVISLRLLYYGSVLYVQVSKTFALILCVVILLSQFSLIFVGVMRYAA
ncbi:hypothetical protein BC351_33485 [Paenibacillus ferrarius]|uniref:Yip1 domain-containing protein n=1 Tax=Paenibacillus ferrarius TaxID=1469647 RepID=A0A1V4HEV6_9BACL|nr:YIP1 family protein [Paenibacillus ferrarius]OPH52076.1 hypothetical protein BC351_33485 [Paenibacillus ferrarius]